MAPKLISPLALVVAASLAAGCELRRDGEVDEPTPTASQTPAASIIREDVVPTGAVAAVPEPVELVIPFPDGASLSASAERRLVGVLESRALQEDWPVVLGGHTDSAGNDQANLRASRARAEAVAAWLVEHGVEDARITVIAFGEQNPVAPNALPDGSPSEAGRRANRRVELRIAPPANEPREPEGQRSPNDGA